MWPHRWQPTRLPHPWDSPGKNTGVGCHFLLQCKKVKSLSRVQLLATLWTVAHQVPPSMGIFQARVLEWGAIAFSHRGGKWYSKRTLPNVTLLVSARVGMRAWSWQSYSSRCCEKMVPAHQASLLSWGLKGQEVRSILIGRWVVSLRPSDPWAGEASSAPLGARASGQWATYQNHFLQSLLTQRHG